MSTYGTVINSGVFTGTGNAVYLPLVSDLDWMTITNVTEAITPTQNHGFKYEWFRGMTIGNAIAYYHAAASDVVNVQRITNAMTLLDTSTMLPSAQIAAAGVTDVVRPIITTANTLGMPTGASGAIVRIQNSAMTNLNGLDFSIDTVVANTSFRLANALSQAPGIAGGACTWQLIAPAMAIGNWYPKRRIVANITQANPGVITTLVDHGYVTGEQVRMTVPASCGMIELDETITNKTVTVTVLSASTFSIGIDTTGFTAFTFPLFSATPCQYAQVMPIGESSAGQWSGFSDDASINNGSRGIYLAGGILNPAGSNGDMIQWVAGKSINL